jgi:cell division protein FtsQ
MPLQMADPEDDDSLRFRRAGNPWWRPSSTLGRVFFGLGTLVILTAFISVCILLKTSLGRDARFRITGSENIEATGLTQVSRAEMLPVFGEDIGRNIFFVPLGDRRQQLEQIPWVERATVMRLLPDQIRISIVERKPVAFTRHGQQIGLVDASGVLLSMSPSAMAQHRYSFPVLTGIDPGDPLPSRKARMALYERLLGELDSNNQHLSDQISEIDLTDPEDARVLMPEQGSDILAHFGEDRFLERYQRYKAHIAEWRQQYPKLAAVDLRYDQQVVLEMAHGSTAVEPTPGAEAAAGPNNAKPSPAQPAANAGISAATEKAAVQQPAKHAASSPAGQKTASRDKTARERAKKDKTARDKTARCKIIRDLTAKDKAEKDKKQREAAQPSAMNSNTGKPAPITGPVDPTGQGE